MASSTRCAYAPVKSLATTTPTAMILTDTDKKTSFKLPKHDPLSRILYYAITRYVLRQHATHLTLSSPHPSLLL